MKITPRVGAGGLKAHGRRRFQGGHLPCGPPGTYGSDIGAAGTVLFLPHRAAGKLVGHALADIDRMRGTCTISRIENGVAYIEGEALSPR